MEIEDKLKILNIVKHNQVNASKKLTKVQWETIEQSIQHEERKVLEMLRDYGSGKDISGYGKKQVVKILADDFYSEYRSQLVIGDEFIITNNKNTDMKNKKNNSNINININKKNKKLSNSEIIKINNSKTIINKIIMDVFSEFNSKVLRASKALTNDILEIVIFGFIYSLWFYSNYENIYNSDKKKHYPRILSCIISAIKLINYCEKDGYGLDIVSSTRTIKVSELAVSDLKEAVEKARKVFIFDIITIYEYAPNLVHSSVYDKYIPKGGMKPYIDQIEVVDFIKKNRQNNFILSYETTVAGGKTTNVVAIIALLRCLIGTSVVGDKKWNGKLLFVCNSNTVRNKVGGICYSMNIKFGMATIINNKVKIIKHYDTPSIALCECVIASPDAASELLKKDGANDEYLLFLDEPTIGADIDEFTEEIVGFSALHHNVNVMRNMPRWSILSSATLPSLDDLKCFVDLHKLQNKGNHVINTISSKTVHIGCDFYDFQENLIYPYSGCTTTDELKNIINTIKNDPFLGKKCTYNVALDLWNKCKESNIPIINMPKEFEDVNNISAEKVKDIILKILIDISNRNNDDVKYICSSNISNNISDNNKNKNKNKINLNNDMDKLGTSLAYKFRGMTIIADIDPIDFVQKHFTKLLQDVKNECGSFKYILTKYKKDLENYNKEYFKLKKDNYDDNDKDNDNNEFKITQNSQKKKKRNNDDNDDIKIISVEEQLSKLKRPKFGYPDFAKINTASHYDKYADSTEKMNFRITPSMEDLPYDEMNVPDFLLDLLNCGIGVYAPSNKLVCSLYTSYVEKFLKEGNLAYIVCSVDMGYGTDVAYAENVIITSGFSYAHSVPTINQMAGRVARPRQKRRGRVFMHSSGILKINQHTKNPKENNIELKNMIIKFNQIEKIQENIILNVIKQYQEKNIECNDNNNNENDKENNKDKDKDNKTINNTDRTDKTMMNTDRTDKTMMNTDRTDKTDKTMMNTDRTDKTMMNTDRTMNNTDRTDRTMNNTGRTDKTMNNTDRTDKTMNNTGRTDKTMNNTGRTDKTINNTDRTDRTMNNTSRNDKTMNNTGRTDKTINNTDRTDKTINNTDRTDRTDKTMMNIDRTMNNTGRTDKTMNNTDRTDRTMNNTGRTDKTINNTDRTDKTMNNTDRTMNNTDRIDKTINNTNTNINKEKDNHVNNKYQTIYKKDYKNRYNKKSSDIEGSWRVSKTTP